ncbi:hypothetical protein COV21_04035 [Candidatus Woesearchaeota archaeon CG10_big_fil_rev_8_21_14_0_10_45_5]|nr:MAG: hypothetical protein COV21_04035 [Candidatus Woesearchaeota archaeon CG10_big_fil_rev_8_21_14_0_10_45_5]PIU30291.1 MAG: hypothetical protein COT07_01475 [Candidatus Woesearchaeota archaeon CG07_land_8_20_14_0_80_44_23]
MTSKITAFALMLLIILLTFGCSRQAHSAGKATLVVSTIGSTQYRNITFKNESALDALSKNFNVTISGYPGLGEFVKCIDSVCSNSEYFWAFYINNQSASLGAGSYLLKDGDVVEFRYSNQLEKT